jgi:nucleoside-diphosphate kinase
VQEKTFFMLKPDGVKRGLEENIFSRLEAAGFNIDKKVKKSVTPEQAADLYQPHLGKKFYPGLIKFITSGPVITCQVSGENVVSRIRELMGDTDPLAAGAGTIRGDLKEEAVINEDGIIKNLVHGSDSPQSAERELAIFFGP